MNILLSIFGVGLLLFLSAIWSGYVLTVLWDWFVVQTFRLPHLSLPAAIGIAIVVRYLTWQPVESPDDDFAEAMIKGAGTALLLPAFMLLFGWIVQFWM